MSYELPEGILKEKSSKKEYRLHVACVDYLKGQRRVGNKTYPIKRPFPQLWKNENQRFTHCYAGRDAEDGFFLKQMGLRRGVFDLHIWPGFHGWLDFKIPGGSLTWEQKQFQSDMESLGDKTATPRSVAELRDILISWGLTCENPNAQEPDVGKEEKQRLYLEMMRPD